ncbi:MAG: phosphatase PAP2 family protein [Eubacteriales bacterium]|nr:phosphatase PAP2 family protein [Eubacteriales bacterium]
MEAIQAFFYQLAVSFDLPILEWIQAYMQSDFLDTIMPIITLFGEGGIFWIAWAVILLIIPKTRKIGLSMIIALLLGLLVCNLTLKPLVARIRPYDLQEQDFGVYINLLIDRQSDFSFPSGHTIASFEAAVVLLRYSKKMGIPALILAILVSFSRLYLYVHYPTDVLASVVLGTAFAFAGCALANLIKLPTVKKGKFER